jgi:hypothetical protein
MAPNRKQRTIEALALFSPCIICHISEPLTEDAMITGPLCKAGRALVQVSRSKLAFRSDVRQEVIEMFERGLQTPDDATVATLQRTLEELGAVFIPDEGANGAGVRLKFSRSVTDRLRTLVDEGGPSSTDAVP